MEQHLYREQDLLDEQTAINRAALLDDPNNFADVLAFLAEHPESALETLLIELLQQQHDPLACKKNLHRLIALLENTIDIIAQDTARAERAADIEQSWNDCYAPIEMV